MKPLALACSFLMLLSPLIWPVEQVRAQTPGAYGCVTVSAGVFSIDMRTGGQGRQPGIG